MARTKVTPRKEIADSKAALLEIMQRNLGAIAEAMISQVIARAKRLPPSRRLEAISNIAQPGTNAYRDELLEALAVIAGESLTRARKEVPKKKDVKLAGWDEAAIQLGEFDKLPKSVQDRIRKQTQLLIGTNLADLEKSVFFQFGHSFDTTDDFDMIQGDLFESVEDFIAGPAVNAGAGAIGAQIVNEARSAFFFEPDVLEEIDAFEFVNGDPVSPICQDLAGTVFAKDDPEMFRYTPPLHWNCKSYIRPILKGNLGNKEVGKLRPSKEELEKFIQFSEGCCPHGSEYHL